MGVQKFNSDIDVNGEVKGTSLDVNGNTDISGRVIIGDDAVTTDKPGLVVGDTTNNGQITIRGGQPTLFFDKSGANDGGVILTDGGNFKVKTGTLDSEGSDQLTLSTSGALTLGTPLATDQQKHLAYFEFKGYGTSDGTNYDMGEYMSDANAPLEHDTSTGADGLTAQTIQTLMRSGGTVMPHDGVLKKLIGWVTSAGSGSVDIGLFKVTPTDDTSGDLTPILLVNEQVTASGNAIPNSFSEDSSFDAVFRAGDIIYSAVKGGTAAKTWYFSSTLEVEWS